jgi:hypothetical protein
MNKELLESVENFLKEKKDKYFNNYSNPEIFEKMKFKFMRKFSELSFEEMTQISIKIECMIESIKIERKLKNISFYSFREFKNIHFKKLNMRFFYHLNENNLYDLYLSFNLNDRRFKNEKISNLSKIELIKMKNNYSLKEREMKLS